MEQPMRIITEHNMFVYSATVIKVEAFKLSLLVNVEPWNYTRFIDRGNL